MTTPDYAQYKTLVDSAIKAAKAYYDTDVELMSDADYDALLEEIEVIEANTGWNDAASLLSAVAGGQSEGGDIHHEIPMLSLAKANALETVQSFIDSVNNGHVQGAIILEPKLDGLAVSALYKNGRLVQVATRGNGTTGEEITARIGEVQGLPKVISYTGEIEVRGEVFITETDFITANRNRLAFEYSEWVRRNPTARKVTLDSLYEVALKNRASSEKSSLKGKTDFFPDKAIFANSRNAVAGALRNEKNQYVVPVTFACYDVYVTESAEVNDSYIDGIRFAETLGFKVASKLIPNNVLIEKNVLKAVEKFGEARKAGLEYPTDGVVLKVNSLKERKRLGEGSKFPKWAIAYKFASLSKQTVVEAVELMIGRTGRLSLRAKVQPVLVDGTLISYASLHNVSWLEEKDIRIGDTVLIRRANDVIPYIDEVVLNKRPATAKKWDVPVTCPQCDSDWDKTTLLWRCPSPECGLLNSIIFAAGRDYFDWEGLSEAIITRLNDEGLVNDIADVFSLTEAQLTGLSMGRQNTKGEEILLGEKTAKKLYEQIQKSKARPLSAVLAALGVRTLGRTFGRRLEAHYGDMGKIVSASPAQLTAVEGIAIKKANLIHAGLLERRQVIAKLAKAGVTMVNTKKAPAVGNFFSGKKIAVTGSIPGYNRTQAQELMAEIGATAASSVSSNTDYLIADENDSEAIVSSKYKKAKALGTEIISPADFLSKAGK